MTRALAEPSVSRFTDLEVEAKSEATILELPHSNQSIEAERDRILSELARELHDQLAQPLNGLLMQTEVFIREQQGNRAVGPQFDYVNTPVRQVLNNMRPLQFNLRGDTVRS